jgi:hypothetical protein
MTALRAPGSDVVVGGQGGAWHGLVSHQHCTQADGINPDRPARLASDIPLYRIFLPGLRACTIAMAWPVRTLEPGRVVPDAGQ